MLSSFETVPAYLFYLPVAVWWALLSLRYRSFTLPALANTEICAGGLCGESKAQALGILGRLGRQRRARFFVLDHHPRDAEETTRRAVKCGMEALRLRFPVVAKPDIGRNGRGVRLIGSMTEMLGYLARYPSPARIIVQKFSSWEGEAGVFYVRHPDQPRGRITSLTLKYFPSVTGDGARTVRQLILDDPRAGRVPEFYLPRLAARLDEVPARGVGVPLVFTGNHCQGSVFRDGTMLVTPAMTARFEAIAREMPGFHFGRFDLRYRDLAALRRGEDFTIIEVNGAGAEATHIWDARTRLIAAYRALFRQVGTAFSIGAEVRRRTGLRPIGPLALLRLYFGELRVMRDYPPA